MLSSEKMQWLAMRAAYRRGMQIKETLDKQGIDNFIPMRYEVHIRNGRKKRELVPVISDLIFVPADEAEPYFSRHNVSGDGTYHKVRFDNPLPTANYCQWHKVAVKSVLQ